MARANSTEWAARVSRRWSARATWRVSQGRRSSVRATVGDYPFGCRRCWPSFSPTRRLRLLAAFVEEERARRTAPRHLATARHNLPAVTMAMNPPVVLSPDP